MGGLVFCLKFILGSQPVIAELDFFFHISKSQWNDKVITGIYASRKNNGSTDLRDSQEENSSNI